MERIVFLERDTFKAHFSQPAFTHEWIEYSETRSDEVVERLRDATIVIANKLPLRERDLALLPKLKLIAVAATGLDNVDLDYCRANAIAVCNVRNYALHSLPEHVLMLILALRRNLVAYREDLKRGEWQKAKQFCLLSHPIRDLYGSKLGIVGNGFLGQAVGKLAAAVGMKVLLSERKSAANIRDGRIPFEETLRRCDVISLHCPLTSETANLIAEPELRLMKDEALLINTARGALVNDHDLLLALKRGSIGGAGLDVLRDEPPQDGNVLLSANLPNLIITPHVAWASEQAMQTLADQVVENLEAFMRGESRNRVV